MEYSLTTLTESYLRFLPCFSFLWNILKYQGVSLSGVFFANVVKGERRKTSLLDFYSEPHPTFIVYDKCI